MIRLVAGVALVVATGAPSAQEPPAKPLLPAPDQVPVEVFAKLPAIEDPRLSPDGSHVAAKMAVDNRQYLVVTDLLSNAKSAALVASGDQDINWWSWVNDAWLAVGTGMTQTIFGTDVYVTRTVGVSADMKTVRPIAADTAGVRADDLIWTARDGTPRILLAMSTGIETMDQVYPSVFEVDVSTGRTRRKVAAVTDVFDWYADGAGIVRAGWQQSDATGVKGLLYRASPEQSFHLVARRRKGDPAEIIAPLIFRADGSAVTIAAENGFDAVYEMSLPDLALGRKLYGVDGYDVDGVRLAPNGDDLEGVAVTDKAERVIWTSDHLREVQEQVDKAVAPRHATIVSRSADRGRLLIQVGSPSQPGALYFFDTAGNRMQRIAWQNDVLKARTLSPVSTVRYQARDGTSIEAVVTLPRSRPAKNLPLIVMPHGGPFARDSEAWDWWSQYLAEIGYAVIQPNYRGSSGYGTAFAKLGEGQWGLKMQDDLDDAAAYLVKQGIADAGRTCMVGASYGGYAAMRAAQRGGGYRCAISYAGVSDLQEMRRYDSQFLFAKTRGEWLTRQAPDFRAVSPRYGAATFSVPILLVHGKADKRVPVKQSRLMAAALQAAGKPYEYLEQPLADHHFTRSEDRLEFLKRMKTFLDRYNPT
ncbi:S9 family peptidase [Sphingomonas sp. KR1UV-12]|uniref:S9 family peptidase n=1 Tax=Sphingomonas aurea TaxID=3063994 RepID=A0ABT9ENV0_9SPHN|nr:S9 family peptidase [Sphingomonas sp. KR1UV-12]MDP1028629.1 S9 family peptidase [Sphingomonas sp. KR1UV-12]